MTPHAHSTVSQANLPHADQAEAHADWDAWGTPAPDTIPSTPDKEKLEVPNGSPARRKSTSRRASNASADSNQVSIVDYVSASVGNFFSENQSSKEQLDSPPQLESLRYKRTFHHDACGCTKPYH